jgi:predicted metalloprotease with PDZ domain
MKLHYRLDLTRTHAHTVEVELRVDRDDDGPLEVLLPTWIPGTYAIRDFARDVTRVQARGGDDELSITKTDKSRWRIEHAPATVTVSYRVYARDLTPHGLYLDEDHAFISPARAFMAVEGALDAPITVKLVAPVGFNAATTLRREGDLYAAADYHELIDHPLKLGALERVPFDVLGARHEWVSTGGWRVDTGRLAGDLQAICEETCRLFDSDAPADPYLFLASLVGEGYGGLEHKDSTHVIASRHNLPRPGDDRVTDGYRTLLGLLSHEYIHAWWVKRVRPTALVRPDLTREVPTRLLWLFEGFTAYYDDLVLVRSGVIEEASYLELLARQITRVLQAPGRHERSIEEASFDAWMLLFRAPEHAPNATVSYYAKGATVALALDLEIRKRSENHRSLDDVVRSFWGGRDVPVDEGAFVALASDAAGFDLSDFAARYISGTEDPPVDALLDDFAVKWTLRGRRALVDRGGAYARDGDLEPVHLGASLANSYAPKILTVYEHTAAWRAGLASGDVLVALDGQKVTRGNVFRLLGRFQPGDETELHVFRDDQLRALKLRFDEPAPDAVYLRSEDGADADRLIRREHWLLGTTPGEGT